MSTATAEQPVVDLKAFVSTERWRKSYMLAPWSAGRWTYATNGIVVVRVPRRDDVDGRLNTPATSIDEWLDEPVPEGLLRTMPAADYNPPGSLCGACDGRGTEHDCPACECDCQTCSGAGEVPSRWSVEWFGMHVDGNHWQQIAALPGAKIGTKETRFALLQFTFDGGGSGAIKPLDRRRDVSKRLTPEAAP